MSFELLEHTEVMEFSFDAIVNDEFDFYGVDSGSFKIDDFIVIPLEDPDDGYRSYLGGCVVSIQPEKFIYPALPLDRVQVLWVELGVFAGYALTSTKNGHVWLYVGTDHADEWYPYTVFSYYPRGVGVGQEQHMKTAEDYSE